MAHLLEADWRDLWNGASAEALGAVYTKPAVVEFILDLAGYCADRELSKIRLLEPSCGDGVFIAAVLRRLIASVLKNGSIAWFDPDLESAITGVDIDAGTLEKARIKSEEILVESGCPQRRAAELAECWFKQTDFLLEVWTRQFDVITGNPPYVRIEALPKIVLSRYRRLYTTITDRADLYVAFIERSLELLSPEGVLAFICANRFAKNQYGKALRRLISSQYHVKYYVNLEHTQPFLSEVSAYPAVIVIDKHQEEPTLAATINGELDSKLIQLKNEASGRIPLEQLSRFQNWYANGNPWVTTSSAKGYELESLQNMYPLLEDSAPNTKVGIGVATGADKVFILPAFDPDIEADRQIPVVLATDITNKEISFSDHYVLNPFDEKGHLVNLAEFPGLARHFERHHLILKERHVARSRPANWYRTIDRIWPQLQFLPKLLLPDIRGIATIGYDKGEYYPHHNLYWIASDWPLSALKCILRSTNVHRQVQAHSVQMRGGHLRFQAQTLRKLRLPALNSLDEITLCNLADLSDSDSQVAIDEAVDRAFSLHRNSSYP